MKANPSLLPARDYARLNVGFTPVGLQVWCVRHDCNVLHVDFEGYKHPGNQTILVNDKGEVLQAAKETK